MPGVIEFKLLQDVFLFVNAFQDGCNWFLDRIKLDFILTNNVRNNNQKRNSTPIYLLSNAKSLNPVSFNEIVHYLTETKAKLHKINRWKQLRMVRCTFFFLHKSDTITSQHIFPNTKWHFKMLNHSKTRTCSIKYGAESCVKCTKLFSEQRTGLCLKQTTYILEQPETGVWDGLVQAITWFLQCKRKPSGHSWRD